MVANWVGVAGNNKIMDCYGWWRQNNGWLWMIPPWCQVVLGSGTVGKLTISLAVCSYHVMYVF